MSIWLRDLTLSEIFDGAEHVLCNGFLILNNFLNDNSLGECLFNSLRHDRLGSSVEKLLLAVTERMCLDITSSISNARVSLPVIVTSSLLTRAEVAVRFLIHFGGFTSFLHGTT